MTNMNISRQLPPGVHDKFWLSEDSLLSEKWGGVHDKFWLSEESLLSEKWGESTTNFDYQKTAYYLISGWKFMAAMTSDSQFSIGGSGGSLWQLCPSVTSFLCNEWVGVHGNYGYQKTSCYLRCGREYMADTVTSSKFSFWGSGWSPWQHCPSVTSFLSEKSVSIAGYLSIDEEGSPIQMGQPLVVLLPEKTGVSVSYD